MSMDKHPCFNQAVHGIYGRIHLPVARHCNIHCGFCNRQYACLNESRPGVTVSLLSPEEACLAAVEAVRRIPALTVAGIAGPGDPLANPAETLETLRLVRTRLPQLMLCLSTNGLALPGLAQELADIGVSHVTVTVNACTPETGAKIYLRVSLPDGTRLSGKEGAKLLLSRQLEGISRLHGLGIAVKVNTVVVPGINDHEIGRIAQSAAHFGADLMNCIPLIPVKGTPLGQCPEPTAQLLGEVRHQAQAWLPQMTHCARCRADALGLLGESRVVDSLRCFTPERCPRPPA